MPFCPSARAWSRLVVGFALTVASTVAAALVWVPADAAGTAYFVAPTGADTNSGTSAAAPFRTIQKALDLAQPGTTITLAPGRYVEAVVTKVAGIASAPITVKGPETGKALSGRDQAVLVSPAGRAFSINHSYYTLDGFTIDGQPNIPRGDHPAAVALSGIRPFKDSVSTRAVNSKLVYVGGVQHQRRHRRHDDLQHVPHRLGRGVRALPQPRREQHRRQLGDPVVRPLRLQRRRRQVQVPQRRGRLRGHEPEVD